MLRIAHDYLPQSILSYVAFRIAYRLTAATQEEHGVDWLPAGDAPAAYLCEVPLLREVSLPVQLELLSETWDRHLSASDLEGSLLDESVIYAACEFAARVCEYDPALVTWSLRGGPIDVTVPADDLLASELRNLYLRLTNDGDFLLISQFLDLPPDEARAWKRRLGLNDDQLTLLFEPLERWRVSAEVLGNFRGLVSVREAHWLARLLGVAVPA